MSKTAYCLGIFLLTVLSIQWMLSWFWIPVDMHQGEVYRIIYLHVPCAFSAFSAAAVLLFASIKSLRAGDERHVPLAKAATEVGLLFTILTLATGSIWGKPTWGTWWTWDARLTTTLLLALMYAGWLLLHSSLSSGRARNRSCAILGIMIAVDVPIIYKSVTWWRTLHQPQTILRPGGESTMDKDMLMLLLSGLFIMLGIALWLIWQRKVNIELHEELKQKSLQGAN